MTDNWYDQMAKAVQKRATAIAGLQRWQEKVAEAESEIQQLTAQRDMPIVAPSDAELAAETEAALAPEAQITFGVTQGLSPFMAQS